MGEDWWVDVIHGPQPDSYMMKDPPEAMPMSGQVGFVLPKKEKPMPEPIKTPLGAEVRVFVTTPDTWLVPAGSVMLQMSIRDVGSYRQAEVVLSNENVDELIQALMAIQGPSMTRAQRIEHHRKINEERRQALVEGGHVWRAVGPNAAELHDECVNCGVTRSTYPLPCPVPHERGV